MEKKELKDMLENMEMPEVQNVGHQNRLRMLLLNSRRTAGYSIILILIPLLFASANILYYEMDIRVGWLVAFSDWISSLDQVPVINWIVRFLLLGGPFFVILLNLLTITHFSYERESNELVFAFKLKWLNIGVIFLCFLLLSVFAAVLVVENVNHP